MEASTQTNVTSGVAVKAKKRKNTLLNRLRQNKVAYFSLWFLIVLHVVVFIGPGTDNQKYRGNEKDKRVENIHDLSGTSDST